MAKAITETEYVITATDHPAAVWNLRAVVNSWGEGKQLAEDLAQWAHDRGLHVTKLERTTVYTGPYEPAPTS